MNRFNPGDKVIWTNGGKEMAATVVECAGCPPGKLAIKLEVTGALGLVLVSELMEAP